MEKNKRKIGSDYEVMAATFLVGKGHRIVDMNYRCKCGEIDIISIIDNTYVFTECKYRSTNKYGDGLCAVGKSKQKRISSVALYYITVKNISEEFGIRFDVIGISGDGSINHIENAFDFCR